MNDIPGNVFWFIIGASTSGLIGLFIYVKEVTDQFNGWRF